MIDYALASAAAMIFLGCITLLVYGERKNIVYARLHLAGVIDVACIFIMLVLGYPLVGLAYLVLVPLSSHAIANAHYLSGGDGR